MSGFAISDWISLFALLATLMGLWFGMDSARKSAQKTQADAAKHEYDAQNKKNAEYEQCLVKLTMICENQEKRLTRLEAWRDKLGSKDET